MRNGGGKNKDHGNLYVKNICKVFERQVELCWKEECLFHPERKERLSEVRSPSKTTTFFNMCHVRVKEEGDGIV